jgi:hypothetical protein
VLAESVAAAAFSLVSMLAIGRVIGPDALGTGTIAIAAFLLLDVFAAALFPDALVQRRAVAARHADSAATASVAVGAAAGLALAAAGPFLAGGSTSSPEVPGWRSPSPPCCRSPPSPAPPPASCCASSASASWPCACSSGSRWRWRPACWSRSPATAPGRWSPTRRSTRWSPSC